MLVEDNAALRRLVASLVDRQADLEVVAQAGSLEEARRSAASVGCDVAILDLDLPDGRGADLIAELRDSTGGVGQSLKIALRAFREGNSPKFVDAEGCSTRILRVTARVNAA